MNRNESEYDKIEGDLVLDYRLQLYGMATNDVVVADGGELILYGMIGGNLVVRVGARAEVYGTVIGDVINHGGEIVVSGTAGAIYDEQGSTLVSPNAVIRRRE